MSGFEGKSVLVLGGSRGIGAAIVRRFALDGAKVLFTYLSSRDEAQALAAETGSEALRADSGDRDALIALIGSLGPLDVLVVNSGILGAGDPLDIPPDEIDRLFRINIHAPYHAAVAAARTMPDGGRIIFIGSANADRMPMAGLAAYSASKSALQGMTRGLARDHRQCRPARADRYRHEPCRGAAKGRDAWFHGHQTPCQGLGDRGAGGVSCRTRGRHHHGRRV